MRVCVYCGSSLGSATMRETAAALGTEIAARGIALVYGGEVIGVIPRHLVAREVAHAGLTELVVVDSMHERKARMADLADGFVTLPGGFGTLDETFEILTWNQLGLLAKPVVFLDPEGFWDDLFAQLAKMIYAALVRPEHRDLARRARTVGDALDVASTPVAPPPPKWADRAPKGGDPR